VWPVETHFVAVGLSHPVFPVWERVSPPHRHLIMDDVSEARHAGCGFDRDSEARDAAHSAAHYDAGSWKYLAGRYLIPGLEQVSSTHDSDVWRAPGARGDRSCSDRDAAVPAVPVVVVVAASPGELRHALFPSWIVAVSDE